MCGVFPQSLDTDWNSRRYESGACIGLSYRWAVKALTAKVWQHRLEVLQPGKCSRLRSKGGSVTEHRKAGPENKTLMTTPFFTNSFKFSEKLSPFDHNTGVGPVVVLKLTQNSLLVKTF